MPRKTKPKLAKPSSETLPKNIWDEMINELEGWDPWVDRPETILDNILQILDEAYTVPVLISPLPKGKK